MELKVPEVGESITEAVITEWHAKTGDQVRKDQLLCELETDKINLELHAETDGELVVMAEAGQTVSIGMTIGNIDESRLDSEIAKKQVEVETAPTLAKEEPPLPVTSEERGPQPPTIEPKEESQALEPKMAPTEDGRTTRKPMSAIRKKIAQRLVAVRQETAMLTTFNEADMSRVMALRNGHREDFTKRHGVPLGYMSFFVKACVAALKDYPEVNARIESDDIVYQHFYDIGIAVGSSRGLIVPVLRDADTLGFPGIEKAVRSFSERAEEGKLDISELTGGTFSITNGGVYGSLLSTPLLNPPQSAILGMHAIQERPVVRDGEIVVRPMMNLALSYDHRIIDGKQAVEFLKRVKGYIEEPEDIFLEL